MRLVFPCLITLAFRSKQSRRSNREAIGDSYVSARRMRHSNDRCLGDRVSRNRINSQNTLKVSHERFVQVVELRMRFVVAA